MSTKVSVLVPTRGRVERLTTLLTSYAHTSNEGTSEMVFRVDNDDAESIRFLEQHPLRPQIVVGPRYQGYRSMPQFFNELAAKASGDVVMCGNDDMVFKTLGWAPMILEAANRYPDGLFDFGVSTHNEAHYPFATVSKQVVDRLGFIWDPRIFWGDIYLRDIMAFFGRCEMLPEVEIEHDWAGWHPDKVFVESDKTVGPHYWTETHWPAVREAVEKLKEVVQ